MKITKKIMAMIILALTIVLTTSVTQATPKFNKTNTISIKKKKAKKGKLKGLSKAQKKKNWKFSSSDKSVVKVKRSGKYGYKITAKKKDGYAVIRAKQGKNAVYLLVKVGKGSKTQNATTKNWALGRFVLPGNADKQNAVQSRTAQNTDENTVYNPNIETIDMGKLTVVSSGYANPDREKNIKIDNRGYSSYSYLEGNGYAVVITKISDSEYKIRGNLPEVSCKLHIVCGGVLDYVYSIDTVGDDDASKYTTVFIESIPDEITLNYNEDPVEFGKAWKEIEFSSGTYSTCLPYYKKALGVDYSKGIMVDSDNKYIVCGAKTKYTKGDQVGDGSYTYFYVNGSTDSNGDFTGDTCRDLPAEGTITIQYGDIVKKVKVTVTDWGVPDKDLYNQWYDEIIRLSGADQINESNVADYYNSLGVHGDGYSYYYDGTKTLIGDEYQWSVDYAKAGLLCNFFAHTFNYTMQYSGEASVLNWYYAQKHGINYIGYSCYANFVFADVLQYMGINAEAYGWETIANREDVPQEIRNLAKKYSGSDHVFTLIWIGNDVHSLDATPSRAKDSDYGEPINDFMERLKNLEPVDPFSKASDKNAEATDLIAASLDAPDGNEEDVLDITDLIVDAEEAEISETIDTDETYNYDTAGEPEETEEVIDIVPEGEQICADDTIESEADIFDVVLAG